LQQPEGDDENSGDDDAAEAEPAQSFTHQNASPRLM
jgi:hypothetical protein